MTYRAYFKLRVTLFSPLSIGDSFSENTDKDVVLDSRGLPVIPATSIAGVLRSLASDSEKDALFGCINKDGKVQQDTLLAFYDATLYEARAVTARDCVKLNEYKTAERGAKFDFQAVETGAVFVGYAEARGEEAKKALEGLLQNTLSFGSKTTRGYGKIKLAYQCREFQPDDLEEWLKFDMFDWPDGDWLEIAPETSQGSVTLKLELKQQGGLSIRQYMTEEKGADYGPMALCDGSPVIPGTSWAGMFKHHMSVWLSKDEMRCAFGFVLTGEEEKDAKKKNLPACQKSRIMFSESQITGGTQKLLTRNMIDRFTNGTKDGALYTEKTVYGGTTILEITLDISDMQYTGCKDILVNVKRALCTTILDLHNGYAAIGGLTAVGRGLFKVTQINGEPFNGGFNTLKEVLGCV